MLGQGPHPPSIVFCKQQRDGGHSLAVPVMSSREIQPHAVGLVETSCPVTTHMRVPPPHITSTKLGHVRGALYETAISWGYPSPRSVHFQTTKGSPVSTTVTPQVLAKANASPPCHPPPRADRGVSYCMYGCAQIYTIYRRNWS